MNDLISRCELFNKLATIQAETPNEMKGKIYAIIQGMETIDLQKTTENYKNNLILLSCPKGMKCWRTQRNGQSVKNIKAKGE